MTSRVDEFLDGLTTTRPARGNLIFALDATGSREATWDLATHLQTQMFREAGALGALDIQAVYFRGTHRLDAECKASNWTSNPMSLAAFMTKVKCRAGITQIGRVLEHVLRESDRRKIGAVVFIGDCCEESRPQVIPLARRLADLEIPIFLFQEGHDPEAEMIFREIAQITHGAYGKFDPNSAQQLGALLRAVAVFAAGGVKALENQNSAAARLLLQQIR
jgi:hypothetical protein